MEQKMSREEMFEGLALQLFAEIVDPDKLRSLQEVGYPAKDVFRLIRGQGSGLDLMNATHYLKELNKDIERSKNSGPELTK